MSFDEPLGCCRVVRTNTWVAFEAIVNFPPWACQSRGQALNSQCHTPILRTLGVRRRGGFSSKQPGLPSHAHFDALIIHVTLRDSASRLIALSCGVFASELWDGPGLRCVSASDQNPKKPGPKPKPYAQRALSAKSKSLPVSRIERSYSKRKKQEVLIWMTQHREIRAPSLRDAQAYWKIPPRLLHG